MKNFIFPSTPTINYIESISNTIASFIVSCMFLYCRTVHMFKHEEARVWGQVSGAFPYISPRFFGFETVSYLI